MEQVRAKKALGQHFLTDLNIAQKICNSLSGGTAEQPDRVLEVGCGMGVLTQYLLKREDIVTYGVDIDTESIAYLPTLRLVCERVTSSRWTLRSTFPRV